MHKKISERCKMFYTDVCNFSTAAWIAGYF